MSRLSLDGIERRIFDLLRAAGADAAQAGPVARSIRRAEADSIGPVGLGSLATYLAHLQAGRINGRAQPRVEQPRLGTVLVDAAHGFAHPAFDAGVPSLIAAARRCGSASLAIRRSYSIGVLGHPVEDLALQGLV